MAADSDNLPQNHPGGPNFTQRPWSEEVAIARANAGETVTNPQEVAYVFSNGRVFRDSKQPL